MTECLRIQPLHPFIHITTSALGFCDDPGVALLYNMGLLLEP